MPFRLWSNTFQGRVRFYLERTYKESKRSKSVFLCDLSLGMIISVPGSLPLKMFFRETDALIDLTTEGSNPTNLVLTPVLSVNKFKNQNPLSRRRRLSLKRLPSSLPRRRSARS
ncbi:unnamed protein product [Kuraishia capsulata CBS 1993]|uniref:Uncharacterized protein n=1 Tax=Kuraishia capsulata CBS 1993 TaxID=1382522 RepID=W6MMJ4_9ASCO|nr:uncharacterized protein KUCA_T00003755001 [Kuraishia capsulata CBS 1993]CDK27776.1 unnamed protein product [Kuraishia capsulata CBS 1993]